MRSSMYQIGHTAHKPGISALGPSGSCTRGGRSSVRYTRVTQGSRLCCHSARPDPVEPLKEEHLRHDEVHRQDMGKLYEHDYHAWLQAATRCLRERRLADGDFDLIADELESTLLCEQLDAADMSRRIVSNLLVLQYAPEAAAAQFYVKLHEWRYQLNDLMSPAMEQYLSTEWDEIYDFAKRQYRVITCGQAKQAPPSVNPFTIEQVKANLNKNPKWPVEPEVPPTKNPFTIEELLEPLPDVPNDFYRT